MAIRGYRTISLELPKAKTTVPIRASARIADALDEISAEMSLYHGVRLLQVLEAVYTQGNKDGARTAFAAIDESTAAAKAAVPHRSVGRPKRRRTAK
jgi:sulfate adenylyltransferase subunit 1 (EFTu-like GTPase family)